MWLSEEDLKCKGCGHLLEESMALENDGLYDAKAFVCHGCAARERAAKAQENPPPGQYWSTTK